MKAIRIENLKALADTGFIDFRRLALLVGRNSSGKSTFLRTLPLLRQSVEAHTTGPILWYGGLVDFGGFSESLASFAENERIKLGFRLVLRPDARVYLRHAPSYFRLASRRLGLERPLPVDVHLAIVRDPKDNSVTRFETVELSVSGQSIGIQFDRGEVASLTVNGREIFADEPGLIRVHQGRLLPLLSRRTRRAQTLEEELALAGPLYRRSLALPQLVEALTPMFHGNTVERTVVRAANLIPFGTDEEVLDRLQTMPIRGKHWQTAAKRLKVGSPRFKRVRDLAIANALGDLLAAIDEHLAAFAGGIRYVKPVRANAERFYRQQDLAVDEVDPEGRNLAMFLRGLTEFERKNFEAWTAKELGWRVRTSLAGGHLSIRILDKERQAYNLADVGFGFSQILPVVAQLWSMQRRAPRARAGGYEPLTFVVEQPELHLHPALQALVADVMLRALNAAHREGIDLRIVVETHSEAIINRVGQRVREGEFPSQDAAVVLFEQDAQGRTGTRVSGFDKRGLLENWPFGFFEPSADETPW